ncbi:PREDICTED: complement factor H-related protein 5 [Elephantulus edwardii]|uniref:complement factor H-related protein 5 n=1 Tax=Elephantulus edwardii TaxID=28737 RepID=UPI0003F05A20|nr:PREDICTED: complement factor H-related protein 5 [Elephantulus edwardii]
MLLLINAILILWVSTVGGQVGLCNFPKIKHGILYDENRVKLAFPVAIGTIIYYSCEYNFVSPSKSFWTRIICTEEGWSPIPKCLRLCFFPSVENGQSASSGQTYVEGDNVIIYCNTGYSLSNSGNNISCTEDGWSSPPTCIRDKQVKACGAPPPLLNGKLKETGKEAYGHSAVVEYDCDHNFQLKGPRKIQCMDGEWTTLPICVEQVKTCGSIPKLENGYVQTSVPLYQHGDSIELSCKKTHTMIGKNVTTCIDGQWTQLPQCIELKGQCGPPPSISNGDITSFPLLRYPAGSTVTYLCQSLYELQGSANVICNNGQWSEPPRCIDACVISGENMDKNNIELRWTKHKKLYSKTGDVIEFKCTPGHKMKTPQESFRTVCQEGKIEYPRCE